MQEVPPPYRGRGFQKATTPPSQVSTIRANINRYEVTPDLETGNDLIDSEKMKKLSYKYILDWLIEIELLTVSTDSTGKKVRRPTYNGADIGISIENRVSANGPYQVVVYNKAAQMFILDNLDAVIMQNGTK